MTYQIAALEGENFVPFIREWISKLRSDEYQQGRHVLMNGCQDTAFCCLGVMCDMLVKKGVGEWKHDRFRIIDGPDFHGSLCAPPPNIQMYLNQIEIGIPEHLMQMNDHHRKTFKEIADYVEMKLNRFLERVANAGR